MNTYLDCIPCFIRQGIFETLSGVPANIFFLFKAKCPVVARHLGVPVGTHVAARWQALREGSASACDR